MRFDVTMLATTDFAVLNQDEFECGHAVLPAMGGPSEWPAVCSDDGPGVSQQL